MVTAAGPGAAVGGAVVRGAPDGTKRLPVEAPSRIVTCVRIEAFSSMSGWMRSRARGAWTSAGGQAGWRAEPGSDARSSGRSRRAPVARPETRTAHAAEVGSPECWGWDTVTVGRSAGIASACFGAPSVT